MIAALFLAAAVHAVAPTGAVVVRGEVPQVLVVAGDVLVEGHVTGNVAVVLGDVVLGPGGRVDGDLVVLGGSVQGSGTVCGKTWVVGGRAPAGVTSWAWALARLGLWLVASFLCVALWPRAVRTCAGALEKNTLLSAVAALGFLLLWLAVAVAVGVTVRGGLALFLWGGLAVTFLGLKAVGLVGLAWVIGGRLRVWLPLSLRGEIPRTGVAMAGLVLFSWLPVVGMPFWVVVNLLGLGGVWLGLVLGWPLWQVAGGKASLRS